MSSRVHWFAPSMLIALGGASPGLAAITIDFENLAPGTSVSSTYRGVTFSRGAVGGPYLPCIDLPTTTTSGQRSLSSRCGGDDFSVNPLRMSFAAVQRHVSLNFGIGDNVFASTTIYVDVYYNDGSATPQRHAYTFSGTTDRGACLTHFEASSYTVGVPPLAITYDITRIELSSPTFGPEILVDDLRFDADSTTPIVEIQAPILGATGCVCDSVAVTGSSYDPDGQWVRDDLEYSLDPDGPWIHAGSGFVPALNTLLYSWSVPASISTSRYVYLRITASNADGLSTAATTVVFVDRDTPTLSVANPIAGNLYGGAMCIDAASTDVCGAPLTYQVRKATGVPVSTDITPIRGYAGAWDTRSQPDGTYFLRVTATDACGRSVSSDTSFEIDNTPPVIEITSPAACLHDHHGIIAIRGSVADSHLGSWGVAITGGPYASWLPIPTTTTGPVVNGLLANWDTTGLPPCAYTIRLSASDASLVNCSGPNVSEVFLTMNLGCPADVDNGTSTGTPDGGVTIDDLLYFLSMFEEGC